MDEFAILRQKQAEIKRLQVQAKTMAPDKKKKRKKRSGGSSGLQNFTVPRRKLKLKTKSREEIEAWENDQKKNACIIAKSLSLADVIDLDDDQAAMPNSIARSALFAPVCRGRRGYIKDTVIASRKDVTITYSGDKLDTGDSDVFLQVIRLAAEHNNTVGTEYQIQPYGFLLSIGRGGKSSKPGKKDLIWLQSSLRRLKRSVVTIETSKILVDLSLIDEYSYDKNKNIHQIRLNPKIIQLFKDNQYGLVDLEARKQIKIDLGKWLQTYIASNKTDKEQMVSLKKLQKWSGQEKRRKDHFKTAIIKALNELKTLGILKKWNISDKGILKFVGSRDNDT